ncbi:hypothetical protein GCM10009678_92260 [Actinomadura kijaniata]|uniref:Uncharacterized protein n=1 Tax=Actinomadura namibiensis TaxID=182080 RepID=A0A7W3LZW7_ACTNM|nr:hypothetical protein [Actinomadura namibiensis]MBA8957424.1 hypothetical protein [Actinomadura namibiensis]
MTVTEILAFIGALTVILTTAVRLPQALSEFLHACVPVLTALHHLRAALTPPDDNQ